MADLDLSELSEELSSELLELLSEDPSEDPVSNWGRPICSKSPDPLGAMNFYDPSRADEFVKISGSKMRKFAREGVTPPDGYMCPTGWQVVADFYKAKAAAAAAAEAGEPAAKKARV